jgi:hypothetical protein
MRVDSRETALPDKADAWQHLRMTILLHCPWNAIDARGSDRKEKCAPLADVMDIIDGWEIPQYPAPEDR